MLLVQAFPNVKLILPPSPPKISYGVTLWREDTLNEIFLVTSRLSYIGRL